MKPRAMTKKTKKEDKTKMMRGGMPTDKAKMARGGKATATKMMRGGMAKKKK
jgi:hypothetical protein